MNNITTLGIMPKDYGKYSECTDSMVNFGIFSSILLIIAIIILILAILDKKSKFRIPIIVLSILSIPLCIAGIILSLNLS